MAVSRSVVVLCVLLLASAAVAGGFSTDRLLTEYLPNPLGIDQPNPRFSWRMVSSERNARQSAYQVQVASSEALLSSGKPDMWDSGKVASSDSVGVRYSGSALKSGTAYYWRVRIWDGAGKASGFGKAARFEMALLNKSDWKGSWITFPDQAGGNGYHSQFSESPESVKWVQIDLGKSCQFGTILIYPAHPYNWKNDVPDFGFPVRYRIETSDDPSFANPKVISDRTDADQRAPQSGPAKVDVGEQTARFVRLVATKLQHPKDTRPLLALAEVEVLGSDSRNIALSAPVSALDSIEDAGWGRDKLTDGGRVSREPSQSSPMVRREFTLTKPVASARAYVTGLGYYELHVNGERVGDKVLDPAYTNFNKRVHYSTYDVTKLVKRGGNAVAAFFGQGWWKKPAHFILQMEIAYKDGTRASIVSDGNWRWAASPVVANSIYNGETYDARLEQPGWDKPGFDDSKWGKVKLTSLPAQLSAETIQPIKVTETIKPKSVKQPKPGLYVIDFGQNFSGWCRIKVSGKAGTQVRIRHAESLYEDGTVNQENLRSAQATDTYILRGDGVEVYQPHFTYHGFRYAQVDGYPGEISDDSILGCVVHTSFGPIGSFSCSNKLINDIQSCCVWGERTNFHSIPTDCPQRDERLGWMGDAHMSAYAMLYNFDMPAAYSKFLTDIQDAQGPSGEVPDTVPHVWGTANGDPMWSIAYPLVLWDTYLHTGDRGLLSLHYDGIKRYVEFLRREAGDSYIISRNTYGDWIAVVGTPGDLISTGSFVHVCGLLANMAEALGKADDARTYRDLRAKIASAFNAKFLSTDTNQYGNASQFSNAFPLYLGIVPADKRKAVLDNMVNDVMVNHKGHLSCGFIGTPYLMAVLLAEGRADVAYTIATQPDYPGWGYMLSKGATTIWELWQYQTGNGMNSHNHPALGFVSGWFYEALAGLRPDNSVPGWGRVIVAPHPVGDLKWAKGKVDTIRGTVESDWKLTDTGIVMKVAVPANSAARIAIPKLAKADCAIAESGNAIWAKGKFVPGVAGVRNVRDAGGRIDVEVGSGEYVFEMK